MCSVLVPIPSAEKTADIDRTREWLNAVRALSLGIMINTP
jgi:hypothetical protein